MTAKDPERKHSVAGGGEERFNLDNILSELGSFGKYQLLLLLLLAFRDSFLAMCNFHYIFTAANVDYRCYVPECEYLQPSEFNASWTQFALPNASSCYRLELLPTPAATAAATAAACSPARFDSNREMPCNKIVYRDYNSIVAEFDLGCSPWKGTLVGTVHNLGLIFSNIISGLIADRYGRKVIIVGTPLMVGVLGLLKSFAGSYWLLLVLEFLETALGYGNASLVLTLESVQQRRRVAYGCVSDSLATLGAAALGLIAWRVPYWRHLVRAIYAPLLVVVFYIFLVDEGVRWLLAHGKREEAVRVLHKVAKVNNVTLSRRAQDMLLRVAQKNKIEMSSQGAGGGGGAGAGAPQLWRALRSRAVARRVALIASTFFCCSFVYNGSILNATAISGDPHVNVSAMLLVSVPTRLLLALTLTRFGRRGPICVAYLLCAIFFVTSAFVPKSTGWASTLLYVGGKMASSYGNFAVFVVAAEAFPTTSRNSLVNIASTLGRLGSVLAPQAPLLAKYMDGLPSVIFGLTALCACALALLLPDTSDAALPDDVRDLEHPPQPAEPSDLEQGSGEGYGSGRKITDVVREETKSDMKRLSFVQTNADDPPKYPLEEVKNTRDLENKESTKRSSIVQTSADEPPKYSDQVIENIRDVENKEIVSDLNHVSSVQANEDKLPKSPTKSAINVEGMEKEDLTSVKQVPLVQTNAGDPSNYPSVVDSPVSANKLELSSETSEGQRSDFSEVTDPSLLDEDGQIESSADSTTEEESTNAVIT